MSNELEQTALSIFKKAVVIDGCLLSYNVEKPKYVDQLQSSGLTAGVLTACVDEMFLDALRKVEDYIELVEKHSDKLLLATTVDDIKKAKEKRKVAIILGFQNAKAIEDDISFLKTFHRMGVKIIQLTYNAQNMIGTGCCEFNPRKLSFFGEKVVEEMNRLGIVVDLSHCSDETTDNALEVSKDPVVFTHANPRSLNDIYGRNKTDEQIHHLAEKDGVMGVCAFPRLVNKNGHSTIEDLLDMIDYIVKLVGVNHVGMGLDLCKGYLDEGYIPQRSSLKVWAPLRPDIFGPPNLQAYPPFPVGIESHKDIFNITKGLVHRGYSEQEIEKILGGNFLRVFKRIW